MRRRARCGRCCRGSRRGRGLSVGHPACGQAESEDAESKEMVSKQRFHFAPPTALLAALKAGSAVALPGMVVRPARVDVPAGFFQNPALLKVAGRTYSIPKRLTPMPTKATVIRPPLPSTKC